MHHISADVGLGCIAWTGHILDLTPYRVLRLLHLIHLLAMSAFIFLDGEGVSYLTSSRPHVPHSVWDRIILRIAPDGPSVISAWTHGMLSYPLTLGFLAPAPLSSVISALDYQLTPFLAMDWSTQPLFTHHAWTGGFLIVGSGAHAAMFCVQDYRVGSIRSLERVLAHRHSIIAHLNWIAIFTGFHSFGLYIHNDTLPHLAGKVTASATKEYRSGL